MRLSLLLLLILITYSSFADDDQEDGWVSTQSSRINSQVLETQSNSDDAEIKRILLEGLEKDIEAGRIGPADTASVRALQSLALDGLLTREINSQRTVLPELKMTACRLLGEIGGEEALDTLLFVLEEEDDPTVLASVVWALSEIDIMLNKEAFQLLTRQIRRQNTLTQDNYFADSVLVMVEKLYHSGQAFDDAEFLHSLLLLAEGNYIDSVKQRAWRVIEILIE